MITHEINRILRDISKQTNEADQNKEEHKAPWPSAPGTPSFHGGMSPHLAPHKSSHGPPPTPINLERVSPNGTITHQSSQPIVPTDSPRKNSISTPAHEWSDEDTVPTKG